jgi:hypothetical protein
MSYMEIFGVRPDGVIESKYELKNSWLGSILVWQELGNKYLGKFDYEAECNKRELLRRQGKDPDKELGRYDPMGVTRSWALQNDARLSDAEWCALVCTFDNCIVPREQFDYVARCFREFGATFGGHYPRCAEALEKLRDEGYIGYCINATSVNENPWWVRDPDEEEGRPYDINLDKKHWFFDPLQRVVHDC